MPADLTSESYEKEDNQTYRTVYSFGIDDICEEHLKCPGCGDWVEPEEIYEAMNNKKYCKWCGMDVDEDLRYKWGEKNDQRTEEAT